MKMHEYLQIERQVQSLADSTDLTVDDGSIRAVFTRRRSPYVSHRSVEFSYSTEPPGSGIVIQNDRFRVVINPGEGDCNGSDRSVDGYRALPVDLTVPSRLLLRIWDEIAAAHGVVSFPPLVGIRIWIPVLTGWDDDRRPIFDLMSEPAPQPSEDDWDATRFVPTAESNGLDGGPEYEEE